MSLSELLDQGQSKARPGILACQAAIQLRKGSKEFFQILLCDADPGVGDGKQDLVARSVLY